MQPPQTFSAAGVFAEAIGLACSIGLLHAITESTLLGLNGIRPSPLDLLILVATAVCAGSVLAICIALAALLPPFRLFLESAHSPHAFRRVAWTILTGAYVLVFLRIVYYWSGAGALLWFMAAVPTLSVACVAVYRKGQRAAITVCASALVAATLCALQLAHADWNYVPASDVVFAVRLVFPILVCLALLVTLMKTTPRHYSFEPIIRGAWLWSSLLAVWVVFWVNLNFSILPGSLFRQSPAPGTPERPNILLIVFDTVRADHLDLFGYKRQTMPSLRRFALDECTAANLMTTTGSWTLPSHASMFTGLYPSAHGAHRPFLQDGSELKSLYPLPEDVETLAGYLTAFGYRTAGIAANFGVLSGFGLPRGFEYFDAAPGRAYLAADVAWLFRLRFGDGPSAGEWVRQSSIAPLHRHSALFGRREPPYRRAHEITDEAVAWLDTNGGDPFFLFLNYFDAHDPYLPIPEDDELFAKRPPGDEWLGFPTERFRSAIPGEPTFTPRELEFLKAQYDAELVSLDREFARLIQHLKDSGLFGNTLILVTTDHGEAFSEHGFIEHGNSLYQEEIGGFLLVKRPLSFKMPTPSPSMQFVDFFPTIVDMLGEPPPAGLQGSPWGHGRDYALSELFCELCAAELHSRHRNWPAELKRELLAIVIGDQKFIRSTNGPAEVYNLAADPAETKPVGMPDKQFLLRVDEIIAERNERLVEELSKQPQDKLLLERLRSLGYI